MVVFGLGLMIGALLLALIWLAQAALLLLGAKLAGIAGRSFARCLGITAIALVATVPAALLLASLPVVGGLIAAFAGFIVTAAAGCGLFRTSFGRALLAAVLAWVILLGAGLVVGAFAMGALLLVG